MKQLRCDILIVGGGLIGLLTALSLFNTRKEIVIVDKNDFINSDNLKKDLRTTAVSEGSKIFLQELKIWQHLKERAEPIKNIRVFDRSDSRAIDFENLNNNKYLGYVLKNSILKKNIIKLLKKTKNVKFLTKSEVNNISYFDNYVKTSVNSFEINSKILIAADGKNSFVRKILKTPIFKKTYKHSAMVANISHQKSTNNTAYEIFLKDGPLAILPMSTNKSGENLSSIIWSNEIYNLEKVSTRIIKEVIEEKICKYTGDIIKIFNLKVFPLSAHLNSRFYEKRTVYVGDAAHSIHPIAGQGWNLGVRDVKNICTSIKEASFLGLDVGDDFVCKKYNNLSFFDAYILYQITDKLNFSFLREGVKSQLARGIGFKLINGNTLIKKYITNFAMGI